MGRFIKEKISFSRDGTELIDCISNDDIEGHEKSRFLSAWNGSNI